MPVHKLQPMNAAWFGIMGLIISFLVTAVGSEVKDQALICQSLEPMKQTSGSLLSSS